MKKLLLVVCTVITVQAKSHSFFEEMEAMMRAHMESMTHMFEQFDSMKTQSKDESSPRISLTHDEQEVKLTLPVGDIKAEDISVEILDNKQLKAIIKTAPTTYTILIDNGMISWSSKSTEEKADEKDDKKMRHAYSSHVQQKQTLPYAVDVQNVRPVLENGTLTMSIPRKMGTKIAVERK